MRIVFLAGANSTHSYRWIKYFAEKGHEVHWMSSDPPTSGSIENVNFYKIKQFPLKAFQVCWTAICVKRLIKKINPDILHAHYAGVNGLVGALSGFHPLVITAWGSDVLIAGKSRIKGPLVRFALNQADLITCSAKHMMQAMTEMKIDSEKIAIVYFGTDIERFKPKKNEMLRNKLRISDSPVIISLRNFEPVYNLQSLIQAIPLVLKEISESKFVIAGRGPEEKRLKNLAKSLGVSKSIRFVGPISNGELSCYLASADVYVSTSLSDGLAVSTTEAMASGLPVIITDFGDNRRWVKDGINGFIIPLRDPEALATKIIYLLQNEEERKKFGKINRQIIEEKHNWKKEMGRMENIYEEIVKQNE